METGAVTHCINKSYFMQLTGMDFDTMIYDFICL